MESRWGGLVVPRQSFIDAASLLTGRDFTNGTHVLLVRPPPNVQSRLLKLHAAVSQLAKDVPDILTQTEVARAIEQQLLRAMVSCVAAGLTDGDARHLVGRLGVMKRLEQYLRDNPLEPLYVTDICAAIGVTDRTLRSHCQQSLGMGPHEYLTLRRLRLARAALKAADPAVTTVTQVATGHGFWELGRFSEQYRKVFGELPSVTLRGAPERRDGAARRI
jgi:transcriptional regulator GlxA family with amidase domain